MFSTSAFAILLSPLAYVQLIGFSAGSILFFFLTILLGRYRNPRSFERLLFCLFLALFTFDSVSLLLVNGQLYYEIMPALTIWIAMSLQFLGLATYPALLLHLHIQHFADLRVATNTKPHTPLWSVALVTLAYIAAATPLLYLGLGFLRRTPDPSLRSELWFASPYLLVIGFTAIVCAFLQLRFSRNAGDPNRRTLHLAFAVFLFLFSAAAFIDYVAFAQSHVLEILIYLAPILPAAVLIRTILRQSALGLANQRNLIYAVSAAFVALLYLALIRRISTWLEPYLPPEATVSILLFLLVIFFEPLQRLLSRALQQNVRLAVDRWQRLLAEFQSEARRGDVARLVAFIEARLASEFRLANVSLTLSADSLEHFGPLRQFLIHKDGRVIGAINASAAPLPISAETVAALEFIADQLPAVLDLAHLIEEKLTLERELAERERLALVGQMAASISHNLKNPLGSIKTLLQLQLENSALPESHRRDTSMILSEIDRLSAKLNQLLRYSKPSVRPGLSATRTDAAAVAEQIVALLRADADRRKVSLSLEISTAPAPALIAATEEALGDVLSNLIVNAIEALPAGGSVRVQLSRHNEFLRIEIADDGPGIPAALREKILQPFFTTKPSGTGLGLAIVARRLTEMNASLDLTSPAANSRGTSFVVTIPLAEAAM